MKSAIATHALQWRELKRKFIWPFRPVEAKVDGRSPAPTEASVMTTVGRLTRSLTGEDGGEHSDANVAWRATGVAHGTTSVLTGWRAWESPELEAVDEDGQLLHDLDESFEQGFETVEDVRRDSYGVTRRNDGWRGNRCGESDAAEREEVHDRKNQKNEPTRRKKLQRTREKRKNEPTRRKNYKEREKNERTNQQGEITTKNERKKTKERTNKEKKTTKNERKTKELGTNKEKKSTKNERKDGRTNQQGEKTTKNEDNSKKNQPRWAPT